MVWKLVLLVMWVCRVLILVLVVVLVWWLFMWIRMWWLWNLVIVCLLVVELLLCIFISFSSWKLFGSWIGLIILFGFIFFINWVKVCGILFRLC